MTAQVLKMIGLAVAAVLVATTAMAATQPIGVLFTVVSPGVSRSNAMQNATLTIWRACAPGHYSLISTVFSAPRRGNYYTATVKAVCTP